MLVSTNQPETSELIQAAMLCSYGSELKEVSCRRDG
jgi:hypothetical protein